MICSTDGEKRRLVVNLKPTHKDSHTRFLSAPMVEVAEFIAKIFSPAEVEVKVKKSKGKGDKGKGDRQIIKVKGTGK